VYTVLATGGKRWLRGLLDAFVGPTDDVVLFPWVPFWFKLSVYTVFLINWRSWPLLWHWSVLKSWYGIHWARFRNSGTIASWRRWISDISPVNADPWEVISITKAYAGIDDCDWRGHLSNSSYVKALDTSRMRWCMHVAPAVFEDDAWTPIAGAQYQFIKEIPRFSEYEIRTVIGSWEDKWFYLIHHFVTYPKKKSKSRAKRASQEPSYATGTSNVAASSAEAVVDIPPATAGPPPTGQRPGYKVPPTVPVRLIRKPLPEGAVVHCLAVSMICFKIGRITIPPKVALITSGFGAPEKDRWSRIQALRFWPGATGKGGRKNLMPDMLKGGYKTDNQGDERFWELDEFEERRAKAMDDIFGSFQASLTGLKETAV